MPDCRSRRELGPSSATRKTSKRSRPAKNQNEADCRAAGKFGRRPTRHHCRVPDCREKPASVHGLCRDHQVQIADAFERFYVAAQKVVEDLVVCDIKSLPEAQIDNPFIRHCDGFLNDAIRYTLWDQEK